MLHVPAWTQGRPRERRGSDRVGEARFAAHLAYDHVSRRDNQFEPAGREGVGSLTASLLSEGTGTRDGEALSNALQLLGTSVNAAVAGETGSVGFVSTTGKFQATLDILSDMLLNSTFPAAGLERLRGQRLVALTQARAQPSAIASRVFPRIVFGPQHPYGRVVSEESLKAITRDDIVAFHKTYYQPGRALITVVGDTTPAAAKPVIEKALARWAKGGERPTFSYPPVDRSSERRRFFWWTSPVRRSRRSPSAGRDRRAARRITTQSR